MAAARVTSLVVLALLAPCALAHDDAPVPGWNVAPWLVATLGTTAFLYARGIGALWRASAPGRGVSLGAVAAFWAGWAVAALALASPLDRIAGELFWVHMLQHELLMLVAAPLLVLGTPLAVWSWAVPRGVARALGRAARGAVLRPLRGALAAPLGAWLVHAAALWLWHVPALFNAAAASETWHVAQHASLFVTALLFWRACFDAGRPANGASVLYVLTAMVQTGALGALLTIAPAPWYANDAERWGWTALEDQQLGGLIMWVPAGAIYLAIGLALFTRWLGATERSSAP